MAGGTSRDERAIRGAGEAATVRNTVILGDALTVLKTLPSESVHCCITSPPYLGLRDYGTAQWEGGDPECDHLVPSHQGQTGQRADRSFTAFVPFREECGKCGAHRIDQQIGLEPDLESWVAALVAVFVEVRRVLRSDGLCFVNLGDSYWNGGGEKRDGGHGFVDGGKQKLLAAKGSLLQSKMEDAGLKPKDLIGQPWRLAFALQADGWYLRSAFPWVKRSAMPESVQDRPTSALEYIFMFSKSQRYYCDMTAVRKITGNEMSWEEYDRRTAPGATWESGGLSFYAGKNKHDGGHSHPSGRNLRNADFWYESLVPPYGLVGMGDDIVGLDVVNAGTDEAHYAAFPERLVLPLVKMGTSEHGCCSECGAPWMRQVTKQGGTTSSWVDHAKDATEGYHGKGATAAALAYESGEYQVRTIGWAPGCKHEAPTQHAIVLDPFAGTGTTCAVAAKAGRDYLGIELSPAYVEMAERRLAPYKARLL